jgi:hypothetical protein
MHKFSLPLVQAREERASNSAYLTVKQAKLSTRSKYLHFLALRNYEAACLLWEKFPK